MTAAAELSATVTQLPAHHVTVDGTRISYRRFGPRGHSPVVLLHGRAGHIGWWFGVAPTLAPHHDVVLIDLSGHGDSGHRPTYSPTLWADEVAAVIHDVDAGPARVVGHSMGGHIAAHLAVRSPDLVESLILIDSRLNIAPYMAPPSDVVKFYPTLADGLVRFRLRPRGTTASADLLREVGTYGLIETAEGWRWKFDPSTGQPFTAQDIEAAVSGLSCPTGYVYGDESELSSNDSADYLARTIGRPVPRIGIAQAHHHVPLDQPEACLDAIESLLDELSSAS